MQNRSAGDLKLTLDVKTYEFFQTGRRLCKSSMAQDRRSGYHFWYLSDVFYASRLLEIGVRRGITER
jgi:hypothetical protein